MSGNFDSLKKDIEAPDTLWSMMTQPDEVWDSQYSHVSKELETGLPQAATGSLSKAMTMARGVIPKDMWNNSVLGELVSPSTPAEPAKIMQNGIKKQPPQPTGVPRTTKVEGPRPKRNVKKRTYGDASFEGYGEGYVDDDAQEAGYSTGEGDERLGRKRPKKVCNLIHQDGSMANRRRLYNQTVFKVLLLGKIATVLAWSGFERLDTESLPLSRRHTAYRVQQTCHLHPAPGTLFRTYPP